MRDTFAGYAQVVKWERYYICPELFPGTLGPKELPRVYRALEKSLNSFGASFQNVIKENLYTTDMEAVKKYNDTREVFYKGYFPAATWVQITRIFTTDSKLEAELIAELTYRGIV